MTLKNIDHLVDVYKCSDSTAVFDTTYWVCNNGTFPTCSDSTEVTSLDTYDVLYVDTFTCTDSVDVLKFILGLTPSFSNAWGLSIIYEYKYFYDSIDVDTSILPAASAIGLDILSPSQYNSMTFVFTPASSNRHFYTGNDYDVGFGVLNFMDTSTVDTSFFSATKASKIFYPYPNPAVINEMIDKTVKFLFELPSDSTYIVESTNPSQSDTILISIDLFKTVMVIDIYNTNGEHVRSIENNDDNTLRTFTAEWDMKNQSGSDVASGVYLAYVRILEDDIDGKVLIEEKTKIAVIR